MMSLVDVIGKERTAQHARSAQRPNHVPPGNAAPRFFNMRTLTEEAQHLPFWMLGMAILFAFAVLGVAVEARIQASVERAIYETQESL